jgi:hypothetical protein
MAGKKKSKTQNLSKKVAKAQIERTLESSLADLRNALGKKKFQQRVKKASKLLASGLPKSIKDNRSKNTMIPFGEKDVNLRKDSKEITISNFDSMES